MEPLILSILVFKQAKASAHPILILVISYTHHLSLAQPGKVTGRNRSISSRLPKVKKTDLCFRIFTWCFNNRGIVYLSLNDPVSGVFDVLNILFCHINDHTLSRKGEQWLDHVVFKING